MTVADADRLLTARAVADMIGVNPETVLRWTRAGKVPAIRLPGGGLRYRLADLDAWLSARLTAPPNPSGAGMVDTDDGEA